MAIAKAASEKKGVDIVIIDMRKMSSLGEYFIITSGTSAPQVKAICEHIIERLKDLGFRPWHREGDLGDPIWIVLDYGDVVVHIFHEETRTFYNLERLWGDAPQRRFRPTARKKNVYAKRGKTGNKRGA